MGITDETSLSYAVGLGVSKDTSSVMIDGDGISASRLDGSTILGWASVFSDDTFGTSLFSSKIATGSADASAKSFTISLRLFVISRVACDL